MHGTTDPWQVAFRDTFLAAAKEAGVDVAVTDCNKDSATQVSNIDDLIAQKVDVIVVIPTDYTALGGALQNAKNAGIPVVDADSVVVEEDRKLVDAFVTVDCYAGGKVCGEYLAEIMPDGGKIGALNLDRISSIADRFRGIHDELDELKRSDIQVVERQITDSNTLANVVEDMLMVDPDLKGFVAYNDTAAITAMATCEQLGYKDMIIIGFDGQPMAKQSIADGKMTATLVYSPVDLATNSFNAAMKLAKGETVGAVDVPMWIINSKNIAEQDLENYS